MAEARIVVKHTRDGARIEILDERNGRTAGPPMPVGPTEREIGDRVRQLRHSIESAGNKATVVER